MSILNQTFTIERYDGTETICRDISTVVRRDPRMFRLNYGTHFNFRRIPKNDRGFTPSYRSYDLTESVFWVDIKGGTIARLGGFHEELIVTVLADCKYIIRDGFGRAVHPDVIYQAYVAKYGENSTNFYEIIMYGHDKPSRRRYNVSPYSFRWSRSQRRSCWCGSRSAYQYKKVLSQMDESLNTSHTVVDELVESEWDTLPVPSLRLGSIDGTWYGRDWERPRRSTHKSWKSQSKARKSWAKNLK